LLLFHPVIAARSCEECAKWWFDDDPANGKWTTKIINRGGRDFERPKDPKTKQPMTPCGQCPKRSPEEAGRLELSEKNQQAYQCYRRFRALKGANITPAMKRDEVFGQNMELIDTIVRAHEAAIATGGGALAAMGTGLAGGGGSTGAAKTEVTKVGR
jgi:hypothetical protein